MEDTLSLEDFSFVLWTRPEIRQSLQFGNLSSRMQAKADLKRDTDALLLFERVQSRLLMALEVSHNITHFYCGLSAFVWIPQTGLAYYITCLASLD